MAITQISIGGKMISIDDSIVERLSSAEKDMIASTGQHIKVADAFRTPEQQSVLYQKSQAGEIGRAAPSGSSFHEKGLAVDVANWDQAAPFLNRYGLQNTLPDDKNHFSYGETVKPKFTNAVDKIEQARQQGKTDTAIADSIAEKVPQLTQAIQQARANYGQDPKINNDRDLINFLSVKYSGKMPTTASVPLPSTLTPDQQITKQLWDSGAGGKAAAITNLTLQGASELPIVDIPAKVVGGVVGIAGAGIGGLVGGVATPFKNMFQGKPLFQDLGKNIVDTATETGKFGFDIGTGGAKTAALMAALTAVAKASPVLGTVLGLGIGASQIKTGLVENKLAETPEQKVQGFIDMGLGAVSVIAPFMTKAFYGKGGLGEGMIPARKPSPTEFIDVTATKSKGKMYTPEPLSPETQAIIDSSYEKILRPSVSQTKTPQQKSKYNQNATNAFRVIAENKNTFTDPDTGQSETRSPRTIDETQIALGNTKQNIFNAYDAATQMTGEAGIKINLRPVVSELQSLANDSYIRNNEPSLAGKIDKLIEAYSGQGVLSPSETQTWITNYNAKNKAFYRNPNPNDIGSNLVDVLISNILRRELDNGVSGLTGTDYQAFKNLYGSLSSIESDLGRRVGVRNRQNEKGLIDFFDIYNAGQALGAIRDAASGNLGGLAKTGIMAAMKAYYKHLNNPDTYVKRIFEALDKEIKTGGAKITPKPAKFDFHKFMRPDQFFLPQKAGESQTVIPLRGETTFEPPAKKIGTMRTLEGAQTAKERTLSELKSKLDKPRKTGPGAMSQDELALAQTLREAKGLSAEDIIKKHPDIQLKRDVQVKDIHGNKDVIPEGEVLTPYELKGNKVLLQDGHTYIVSKNQFDNVKGNALSSEAKPFAPELKGMQETVKSSEQVKVREKAYTDYDKGKITLEERNRIIDSYAPGTKYSQYTLPGGENYKEILIKAPTDKGNLLAKLPEGTKTWSVGNSGAMETPNGQRMTFDLNGGDLNELALKELNKNQVEMLGTGGFKSSHWSEPNVISHLRMNERTYKGKKVTFMEELQSDWAREVRKDLNNPKNAFDTSRKEGTSIPNNPLLKNWQEPTIKRALQEAVNSKSEYFSWINGDQTSARYNLGTKLDKVKWSGNELKPKEVILDLAEGKGRIIVELKLDGTITKAVGKGTEDWKGQKLDQAIGKGLADKIMEKETGTLSGKGLEFGGEWTHNLYDKQVGDIVRKLTGAKIEVMDMELPVEVRKVESLTRRDAFDFAPERNTPKLKISDLKVGLEINEGVSGRSYYITDILGDGQFKAVEARVADRYGRLSGGRQEPLIDTLEAMSDDEKKTFDISSRLTTQQGIKLTPEIKAKILGEAPKFQKKTRTLEPINFSRKLP